MGTNAYKVKNHINIQPQASAPSNPVLGDIYCDASGDFFRYDGVTWTGIGGGGEGISVGVAQTGHGFATDGSAIGTPIRSQGTANTYVAAKADTDTNAEVVGFITAVSDANNFTYAPAGLLTGLTGRTVGAVYFLSADTAGVVTTTEPSTVGQISKPCYIAVSATSAVIVNMRGTTVGGTNLYTTIPLNNGAATTIQSLAGATFPNGTGGFIEGFIKIDATTDYTFTFKVEWSKDIAGTTYHVTPTLGAGNVPAGFAISNSGANIQVTLPSVTGFSSASATFSMQAAPIGAQLPLQISGSQVTGPVLGDTSGAAIAAGKVGEVIQFTVRSTTGTPGAWVVNTDALCQLTTGVWSVRARGAHTAVTSASVIYGRVATNTTADGTGAVASSVWAGLSVTNANNLVATAMYEETLVYVSGTQNLYAKSFSEDGANNVTISGFAVRIA